MMNTTKGDLDMLSQDVLRSRFGLSLALAVVAGFLVVESLAFGHATAQSIGWPVGIGALVISLALSPTLRRIDRKEMIRLPRGAGRLAAWDTFATLATLLSGWQIVQALVFSAKTAAWLTFADGCGLLGLALAALVAHELSTERVVHSLDITGSSTRDGVAAREPIAARGS
jgi:hypothetical protein